jgi:hypothetical protein
MATSLHPRDNPFIVIHYIFKPHFTESHIITYDPRHMQYNVDTIEVLRRNASDTHRESYVYAFHINEEDALLDHIFRYLPPTYTQDPRVLADVCQTDPAYMRRGHFYIRDEDAYMHSWQGYINDNGTEEGPVKVYLYDTRKDALQSVVRQWLTLVYGTIEHRRTAH